MRKVVCTVAASKKIDVKADTSIRDRISYLQDREADLKEKLADPYLDEDERIDLGIELAEIQEQLNFAWQDDEAEYNYALQQQEFNPDGSLKGYGDVYGSEDTVDEHEGADLYVVKIWYEVDPGHDVTAPKAAEEIIQTWATSPQEALDYAKKAWSGPIDKIEIVDINPEISEENDIPVYAAGSSEEKVHTSQCSFDFVNDGKYDYKHMEDIIFEAFKDAGVTPLAVDFRSVDYSTYPGYRDKIVSQCGVDFEWSGKYYEDAIEEEVALVLDWEGYELIGMSFESLMKA